MTEEGTQVSKSVRDEMDRLSGELTRLIADDPECEHFDDREKLWMRREELRAKLAEDKGKVSVDVLVPVLLGGAYVTADVSHHPIGATIMAAGMAAAVVVHRYMLGRLAWRSS